MMCDSLGHGDEVQHCVGGAPEGHGEHNGILKRLEGHDVTGLDVTLEQLKHVPEGVSGSRGHKVFRGLMSLIAIRALILDLCKARTSVQNRP